MTCAFDTCCHRQGGCAPTLPPLAHSRTSTLPPIRQDETGNAADCSGYFPGQIRYKDPIRPDASYTIMQEEAKVMAELSEDPKFKTTGKPGNL